MAERSDLHLRIRNLLQQAKAKRKKSDRVSRRRWPFYVSAALIVVLFSPWLIHLDSSVHIHNGTSPDYHQVDEPSVDPANQVKEDDKQGIEIRGGCSVFWHGRPKSRPNQIPAPNLSNI